MRRLFCITSLSSLAVAVALSACTVEPNRTEPVRWQCAAKAPKTHIVTFIQTRDPTMVGGIATNGWEYDYWDVRHCRVRPMPRPETEPENFE